MMDGALSADEAKFLLRRMEHDDALADCWERWQFLGDAMRGQTGRALPADFSRRVGRAIADDQADDIENQPPLAVAARGSTRGPLLRWGGGAALAASVALAALIGTHMLSVPDETSAAVATTASTAVQSPTLPEPLVPIPILIPPVSGVSQQPTTPSPAESLIAQAGTAVVLTAMAGASNPRGSQHPRFLARAEATAAAVALSNAASTQATSLKPAALAQAGVSARTAEFASGSIQGSDVATQAEMTPKPWPRALVPGAAMTGEVTAGFEGGEVFQPFQPRVGPQPARLVEDAASPR
jgi:hypothetical protein